MAQETADTSMSDDDDHQDQAALMAKQLFPPGKHYASLRALQVDLMDWATCGRFGLVSRRTNTACGDDDMMYMGCNRSLASAAAGDDTSPSSQPCTFGIAYRKCQNHPGAVMITQQSIYRHSCGVGNLLSSRNQQAVSLANDDPWIELTETKAFSRILYGNPVCFLSTCNPQHQEQQQQHEESATNSIATCNVMVLSWLTATNNEGAFMFSLNKRRHSANLLVQSEFTLSIPVQGMESLVCNVGGVSGKWGISKFPQDHPAPSSLPDPTNNNNQTSKKRKGPKFPNGIPGLVRVPLGHDMLPSPQQEDASTDSNAPFWPFGIQGTVAHLQCRIKHMASNADDCIDADHHLVFAQVTRAFVHPAYWEVSRKLFRPSPGFPPYLTFFGSQTFGYVSAQPLPVADSSSINIINMSSPTQPG